MLSAEQMLAENIVDKIKPLHEAISKEALYDILLRLRARVSPVQRPRYRTVGRNGNQLVYLVTLGSEGESTDFVFRLRPIFYFPPSSVIVAPQ